MLACLSLAACTGGGGSTGTTGTAASTSYVVGGSVSGLNGSGLVLQNNGGDNLAVSASGSFAFPTTLITGNAYSISVLSQPTAPSQTCAVSDGAGTVSSANITAVSVQCVTKTAAADTIGGTVEGVLGAGLILQDNGGDNLAVSSNGTFTFATALPSGLPYYVTVLSPPINPYQDCVVAAGAGNTGADDVNNVSVTCKTNPAAAYTIGGAVSGISSASPLVLQDNGRDNLSISADGPFQFPLAIPSGSTFSVTSLSVTGQQSQTCTFTNASGTVGSSNITSVAIACKPNVTISVNISGLAGSGLVLQDNGGDNLAIAQNGAATFATALPSGGAYSVTVFAQPTNPTQNCVVAGGSGVASPPSVSGTITIACTTVGFKVGGTIAGLAGTGLVLQDNGGDNLPIAQDGGFVFPTLLPQGAVYQVGVLDQPAGLTQQCAVVSGGMGVIGQRDVADVQVQCTTSSFTLGGNVSGLVPNGNNAVPTVILQAAAGGAGYSVSANGPFTFPAALLSGTAYSVSVQTQPAGYYCAVGNAAGTITNANVGAVSVTCEVIGGYLFVTNSADNTVSSLVIDDGSGALTALGTTPTGGTPRSIAPGCTLGSLGPATLYVANEADSTLSAFSEDEFSGALTLITNPPMATGTSPYALNWIEEQNCIGILVNSGDNTVSSYVQNLSTGALTAAANSPVATGASPVAIATIPSLNGSFAYIANRDDNSVSAYAVDNTAGTLTLVTGALAPVQNPVPTGNAPLAVAAQSFATAGGYVYVANSLDNTVSEYSEAAQGNLTPLINAAGTPIVAAAGNTPIALDLIEIPINGNPAYRVYAANFADNTVSGFTINQTVGAGTQFGQLVSNGPPLATGTKPLGLTTASTSTGYYLYVVNYGSNNVSAYSIDVNTGLLTPVAGSPFAAGNAPTSAAVESPPDD